MKNTCTLPPPGYNSCTTSERTMLGLATLSKAIVYSADLPPCFFADVADDGDGTTFTVTIGTDADWHGVDPWPVVDRLVGNAAARVSSRHDADRHVAVYRLN